MEGLSCSPALNKSGMEGLSCSPALNGITIFLSEKLISSRKSLHPLPAHARTEAKQCFAGSRPSIKKRPIWVFKNLGWKDSNLRMPGPKPGALPLGDIPLLSHL